MPEHLRALIVVLVLAAGTFAFVRALACEAGTAPRDFQLRRNAWFAVTLIAFLAHHFWIYIVAAAGVLIFASSREKNRLALFFALLFAVPAMSMDIPGFAGVRYLFSINHIRLLALAVLLPAFFSLLARPEGEPFGRRWPDRLVVLYIGLNFALMLVSSSSTNALRHGMFYAFTDIFLPYYVASRSLRSLAAFRDAMTAFVMAALVLAAIGIFESAKHWVLYNSLEDTLGTFWGYGKYVERERFLRALGSTGQPIAFGYVMAVALGFCLYLKRLTANPLAAGIALALLAAGLIASVSRGPWLGTAVILLAGLAIGRSPGLRLLALASLGFVILPLLFITGLGERVVDLLPFVGSVDAQTITYRQRLLDAFVQVIAKNPFFGAFDYMLTAEVQDLRQGQGIIDVVNTYVGVGFSSGLVGLSLFGGFFAVVAACIFRAMRNLPDRDSEAYALGKALLATLLGILVMISAVSSITVIPVVYWAVAGLAVGYARMAATAQSAATTGRASTADRRLGAWTATGPA